MRITIFNDLEDTGTKTRVIYETLQYVEDVDLREERKEKEK